MLPPHFEGLASVFRLATQKPCNKLREGGVGFLGVVFGLVAAVIACWTGQAALAWISVVAAFSALMVDRQCRVRAFAAARRRADFDGTFVESDLENVPGALTALTFVLVGVCLVLAGVAVSKAL